MGLMFPQPTCILTNRRTLLNGLQIFKNCTICDLIKNSFYMLNARDFSLEQFYMNESVGESQDMNFPYISMLQKNFLNCRFMFQPLHDDLLVHAE